MTRESAVMRGTVLRVEREAKKGDPLTDQQRQIVLGAADGLTYAGIGGSLGISERTVKAHANVIFVKLDAVSMANAVAIYLRAREPIGILLGCILRGHGVTCSQCS